MKFILILSALFATSAFGLKIDAHEAAGSASNSNYDSAKAAECKKSGGRYKKQGLAGNYVCVKTYKDAFRKCTSSDQCEGDCIVNETVNPIAFCQPDDSAFGCWTTI